MANQPTASKLGVLSRITKAKFIARLLPTLVLLVGVQSSQAGSATWALSPKPDPNWFTPSNWTPATVPDGPADTATFGVSDRTDPYMVQNAEVNGVVFDPGASYFTINIVPNTSISASLTFTGTGITNNSGVLQGFKEFTDGYTNATVSFMNGATAGDQTTFFNYGGYNGADPAIVQFFDSSSAATGTFTNDAGTSLKLGGITQFFDNSTASHGTFTSYGGGFNGVQGGNVFMYGDSTAASGVFTAKGGAASGALGANIVLFNSSIADKGTFIADGGTSGGAGGVISFKDDSLGGTARIEVFFNGRFNIGAHKVPGVTVGSIEGDGIVNLGTRNLAVGSSSLTTTFSGMIQDGGLGGSLTKIGTGTLTLSNVSTYTGGTTVEGGTLLVKTGPGSATGTGAVQVSAGTFGGRSNILGPVTIGTGSGPGAHLAPGLAGPGTFVIKNTLTFNADGTYYCELNTKKATADRVVAKGVTIDSGALLSLLGKDGDHILPLGTVFTVIDNRSRQPIHGTFGNLADDSTFAANGNNFHVSYEGRDGNDLTFTVVP